MPYGTYRYKKIITHKAITCFMTHKAVTDAPGVFCPGQPNVDQYPTSHFLPFKCCSAA